MSTTKFKSLKVNNWRQFASIEIEFHPNLTVLTGANGAGKSTLLAILTQHFGWSRPLLSTPWREDDGSITYITGAFEFLKNLFTKKENNTAQIGVLHYSDLDQATLWVPTATSIEYNIEMRGQKSVKGLSIPSHRTVSPYRVIPHIPTVGISANQAYANYNNEVINRYQGGHTGFSPLFRMKEALLSMAILGEGNKYSKGKPELLEVYLGFIEILKKILPSSLGFQTIEIRTPDVLLITKTGEFLIDSVSGGLNALIDLAWQIYIFTVNANEFVVVIDEPENHLHPSMQRSLMPNLLNAFPNIQFIVATHSPFVVTAVKESNVYVLAYGEAMEGGESQAFAPKNSVRSLKLDQINKAGSANEILRNVLGLEATMPLWVSKELDEIIEKYSKSEFSGDSVAKLKGELIAIGIENSLPDAIDSIFKNRAEK